MSRYRVSTPTRCDYKALALNTPEARLWSLLTPENYEQLFMQPAWAGYVENTVVAIGGVVKLWPGLAEAWIAVTPLALQHRLFILRQTRTYLDRLIRDHSLRRVEAKVREDFTAARRFAEWCGFTALAPLQAYGPDGETFILYEKVL